MDPCPDELERERFLAGSVSHETAARLQLHQEHCPECRDWFEQARQVREKKFGAELPVAFKEKTRQMRFLQYRGFDTDQIQHAMRVDNL